jgi:uncharacterized membrane protein YfcA
MGWIARVGAHLERGNWCVARHALTVAFTVAAIAGTFVGARVVAYIPAQRMRRLFAEFVMLVALFMIVANYRVLL